MANVEHTPVSGWEEPSTRDRLRIIQSSRTVAVVGVSSRKERPSNFVATYLLSSSTDLDVYYVNPREDEVLGRPCFPTLADVPVTPDIVDVFRSPEHCPAVAREAVDRGARTLWLQLGIWSPEAARIAVDSGLDAIMDRCLKIEHARFHGGLHLHGFNTGVVSARRYGP